MLIRNKDPMMKERNNESSNFQKPKPHKRGEGGTWGLVFSLQKK